jgi:TonB family protein
VSAAFLNTEIHGIRARTRKAVAWSAAVHAVLLLVVALLPERGAVDEGLTEITWIDAAELSLPPASAPVAAVERSAPGPGEEALPAAREARTQFVRQDPEAELRPSPQELAAVRDRMRDRLESLRPNATDRRTQLASVAAPVLASRPSAAGLPEVRPDHRPTSLARAAASAPAPDVLVRTVAAAVSRPAPARIRPTVAPPQAATPSSRTGISREVLAGITLTGPIADRALVSFAKPDYPDWAKNDAVEGSVRLHFVVLADGRVKDNVLVERTSGFEEFDRNAAQALLVWHFEALPAGTAGDQWGSITMHYRLGDQARDHQGSES